MIDLDKSDTEVGTRIRATYPKDVAKLFATYFTPGRGAYVSPDIPVVKLDNALEKFGPANPSEEVLGLVDNTVVGSAKSGILFTTQGVYFRSNEFGAKKQFIPYDDLSEAKSDKRLLTSGVDLADGTHIAITEVSNVEGVEAFLNSIVFAGKRAVPTPVAQPSRDAAGGTSSSAAAQPPRPTPQPSWSVAKVLDGSMHFACPSCRMPHVLTLELFTSRPTEDSSRDRYQGLERTAETIRWGITAPGNIVAFVIAIAVGAFVALAGGQKVATWVALALLLMIRIPLVRAFMKRLVVWHYGCEGCHATIEIACDGRAAAVRDFRTRGRR